MLEVIAEGEIAEHLKIGAVTRRLADVLNIARTDAFLAGRDTLAGRRDLAGKILLHRRHAGVDEQKAVVVLRDERKARQAQMPLALKERKILFSQFI